jgi:hypothetical protein
MECSAQQKSASPKVNRRAETGVVKLFTRQPDFFLKKIPVGN